MTIHLGTLADKQKSEIAANTKTIVLIADLNSALKTAHFLGVSYFPAKIGFVQMKKSHFCVFYALRQLK
jgi:hypothetical protein